MAASLTSGAGEVTGAGTGARDRDTLRRLLRDETITLSHEVSAVHTLFTYRFTSEVSDIAFDLLRDMLVAPHFEAKGVEQVRDEMLSDAANVAASSDWRSYLGVMEAVFGEHPLRRAGTYTEAELKAFDRSDIVNHASKRLQTAGMKIAIAGDLSVGEAAKRLDQVFGDLPGDPRGERPFPDLLLNENQSPGAVEFTRFDQPQTQVYGQLGGVHDHDADFYVFQIAERILGEGSESRLFREVREKRGLTYGISIWSTIYDAETRSWLYFDSANETIAEAITATREVIQRFIDEGPSEAELSDAKAFMIGSYEVYMRNTTNIATRLLALQMLGHPRSNFQTRKAKINAVTAADVMRVAAEVYALDNLTLSAVGNPDGGVESLRTE